MRGKINMQNSLYDFEEKIPIGESVRNATYQIIKPDLPEKRQRVYEIILAHPKGITSKDIAKALKWPINCITGRVSELRDKEQLIEAVGIQSMPDYEGKMHPNTIWRAKTV